MDWIESQINNESLFPTKSDVPFPKTFLPTCRKILTRLFRVFVHVYIHHFDRLLAIGAEAHCNTCYKHFFFFVTEFELVNAKEFEPLVSLAAPFAKASNQLTLCFFSLSEWIDTKALWNGKAIWRSKKRQIILYSSSMYCKSFVIWAQGVRSFTTIILLRTHLYDNAFLKIHSLSFRVSY